MCVSIISFFSFSHFLQLFFPLNFPRDDTGWPLLFTLNLPTWWVWQTNLCGESMVEHSVHSEKRTRCKQAAVTDRRKVPQPTFIHAAGGTWQGLEMKGNQGYQESLWPFKWEIARKRRDGWVGVGLRGHLCILPLGLWRLVGGVGQHSRQSTCAGLWGEGFI